MVIAALSALAILNCLTVLAFWEDKQRAIAGDRRTPEADLLTLALIGGWPGALLARQWFRHKTRKEPFSSRLLAIAAVHIGAIGGLIIAFI